MKKIAFVLAHPDDAEIWCGGMIAKELDNNSDIRIFYLYACTEERIKESNYNSKKYGYKVYYLEQEKEKLLEFLLKFNPNLIITHWEYDANFEHRETCRYLNSIIPDLIFSNKMNFKFFYCESVNLIGNNNNFFVPDYYIDISDKYITKNDMIGNYCSQNPDYWKKIIDTQNKLFGNVSGCNYSEGYQQVQIFGVKKCKKNVIE